MWVYFALILTCLPILIYLFRTTTSWRRVTVVVLGDIGRSPRICYHALSLAMEGFEVALVGYEGCALPTQVKLNKKIHTYYLKPPPPWLLRMPRLAVYFTKALWQILTLFVTMMLVAKPSHILVQNPPAIPSLGVCWLVNALRGSKFIIDWHNYGFTILGLSLGRGHPLVKFSIWYEHIFGKLSSANICVTDAMKADLQDNWGIKATTLHDRPPAHFKSSDLHLKHDLFAKLSEPYEEFRDTNEPKCRLLTRFTSKSMADGSIAQPSNRPALLISSTSWTEDEDFSILLQALDVYEGRITAADSPVLPNLLCVITGKGPLKDRYKAIIAEKTWKYVQVCTPWLEPDDYPRLLGSADLGVCLHMSSSGLDLPMKVVDMFGCGLPVCAIEFECLKELVKEGVNGMIFKDAKALAVQLEELLSGFPDDCDILSDFRKNLSSSQTIRWHDNWRERALDLFW